MSLKETIRKRTAETRDLEERIRDAENAEKQLPDLRERLSSLKARQAHFASYKDGYIEFPQRAVYGSYGAIDLAPQRSLLTGNELAKTVQPRIDEIAGLIADKERVIAELAA